LDKTSKQEKEGLISWTPSPLWGRAENLSGEEALVPPCAGREGGLDIMTPVPPLRTVQTFKKGTLVQRCIGREGGLDIRIAVPTPPNAKKKNSWKIGTTSQQRVVELTDEKATPFQA
jgi:hypothetical protein